MNQKQPVVSKWLWISLIIVIIIAGGFFSWFYLMGPGKTKTSTPITTDKTADWKTYNNAQYGFQLKYPSTWIINVETQNGFVLSFTSPEMKKDIENEMPDAIPEIYLRIKQNDNLSLEQFIEKDAGGKDSILSKKETKINNYPAFKCVIGGMVDDTVYYWTKDQKSIFVFSTWSNEDVLNQMLSTFQFTNTNSFRVVSMTPTGTMNPMPDESKTLHNTLNQIILSFSSPIDTKTVSDQSIYVLSGLNEKEPVTFSYNQDHTQIIIAFKNSVQPQSFDTRLTVVVKGVKDTNGNSLTDYLNNIDIVQ